MAITLTPPTKPSSQIAAHGYDPATQTLAVQFKSGGTYHYSGVPAEVYAGMQQAESAGRFLHQAVKGQYDYKCIEPKEEKK